MAFALTTNIEAACHCKSHSFTLTVPTSSLPLQASSCHCTSCRHCTGTLNATAAPWPSPPENHSLERYEFSPNLHFLFCGKCGQKMFFYVPETGAYEVFTACLPHDKGLVQYKNHMFVEDTIDGGSSAWLINPHPETAAHNMPIVRWAGFPDKSDKLDADWPADVGLKDEHELTHGDELPIRCHCGGVNLKLTRPDYTEVDKDKVPWFVDPISGRKWLAIICLCNSCRTTFSADLVPLAFVEMKNIHSASPVSSDFPNNVAALSEAVANGDPTLGTLARYQSSANAFRYHCKRCSASVFYTNTNPSRKEMLDLAVGLIDSPDGARAEGMLWWQFTNYANGDNCSLFPDVKDGWRAEIAQSYRTERQHWRERKGWSVTEEVDEETRRASEQLGDMLI